jgi:hypothetical protein
LYVSGIPARDFIAVGIVIITAVGSVLGGVVVGQDQLQPQPPRDRAIILHERFKPTDEIHEAFPVAIEQKFALGLQVRMPETARESDIVLEIDPGELDPETRRTLNEVGVFFAEG